MNRRTSVAPFANQPFGAPEKDTNVLAENGGRVNDCLIEKVSFKFSIT